MEMPFLVMVASLTDCAIKDEIDKIFSSWFHIQRFSGRLKLHVYRVKIQVEVQSAMTTNYIDAAVYMFCISGHG